MVLGAIIAGFTGLILFPKHALILAVFSVIVAYILIKLELKTIYPYIYAILGTFYGILSQIIVPSPIIILLGTIIGFFIGIQIERRLEK